ncbi:MAG: hypothetical protein QXW65_02275, partial [Candidatus Pacearchaeota archaeon]
YFGIVHESKWEWLPGAGWDCKENCEIGGADPKKDVEPVDRERNWSIAMAKRCRSLGKCGAYNNIVNVRTTSGISLTRWGDVEKLLWVGGRTLKETLEDPELKANTYEKISLSAGAFVGVSERYIYYDFKCLPWQAPPGGENCYKCNEDPLRPCNEERCSSLGQACVFNSDTGKCFWEDRDDTIAPRYISCKKKIENIDYNCQETLSCVKPWMPIIFNVTTDERAQCILNLDSQVGLDNFDNPPAYFGDNGYWHEHIFETKFTPLQNGSHTIYYRCRDRNGNKADIDHIIFSVCEEPDIIAPKIIATSPQTGSSIGKVEYLQLYVYTNEPAVCRWAKQDVPYEQMSNEFNVTNLVGINFEGKTNLTGLRPETANFFYLRCKDTMNNVMPESYVVELFPAPALLIVSIEPENGAIVSGCTAGSVSRTTLKVKTAEGANNGRAICYWKKPSDSAWNIFTETNDINHETEIEVSIGQNTVEIACRDSANIVQNLTRFNVIIDETQPKITRIYKEGSRLVLRTDENATCAYRSLGQGCDFDAKHWLQAIKFSTTNGLEHSTEWRSEPWYVKCYDSCGNGGKQQDSCIVILPSDVEFE